MRPQSRDLRRGTVGKFNCHFQPSAHGSDMAAQRRYHEIAALFHLGNGCLTNARGPGKLDLGECPCAVPEGFHTPLCRRLASASILARRSGVNSLMMSFDAVVMILTLSFHQDGCRTAHRSSQVVACKTASRSFLIYRQLPEGQLSIRIKGEGNPPNPVICIVPHILHVRVLRSSKVSACGLPSRGPSRSRSLIRAAMAS